MDGRMSATGTLVIENVDLDMLDQQRLVVAEWICGQEDGWSFPPELDGIINMLDRWSDQRHTVMQITGEYLG
jgi:hypothetical protein